MPDFQHCQRPPSPARRQPSSRSSFIIHHSSFSSAFTLVELLVVIFIIGSLVALLIPVVGKVKRASQGAATQAQMASIATAIQSYYSDFRAYPGPLPNTSLDTYDWGTAGPSFETTSQNADGSVTYSSTTTAFSTHITGAENLVLGLLGGLDLDTKTGNIAYDQFSIYPGGTTPNPKGAMSLNVNAPKRFASYLQVKTGDISTGSFLDASLRPANDSPIPEFLDKSSQPMPILYLRANPGASGVASFAGKDEAGVANLYQYDLTQVVGYTVSEMSGNNAIGTTVNDPSRNHHGLQGLGALVNTSTMPYTFYPISTNGGGAYASGTPVGSNALAYLRDPNTPLYEPGSTSTANLNQYASPRQKDSFILISTGPDGVYGTADDLIYPGSLNP